MLSQNTNLESLLNDRPMDIQSRASHQFGADNVSNGGSTAFGLLQIP